MKKIERLWSYLLYATWKTLCVAGIKLIERPLIKILYMIPSNFYLVSYFRSNWEKGKKIHRRIVDNPEISINIIFAIRLMYALTTCIYISIFLWIKYFLNFTVGKHLLYWVGAILVINYLTNELLLFHNDKYLKYFSEFEKSIKNKRKIYLHAILFHVVVLLFTVLTLDWTIGIW